ncbi:LOW QUALITY PROTEIN: hypothetical protein RJ640_030864 [Escallonia rubra]|uniref:IPT/TIG domain-containing protein n=1 Tax=Escallonia rubra TaxID=112253 RepID=A0AA88QM93_9ASTE|nr:LOW QUALITY PROTEIN: hypothetical protein RJ640_030864 [Escallonia rubra]
MQSDISLLHHADSREGVGINGNINGSEPLREECNTTKGRHNIGSTSQLSPGTYSGLPQSLNSYTTQLPASSSAVVSETYEPYQNTSSPGSVEVSSDVVTKSTTMDHVDIVETTGEVYKSPEFKYSQALRRLEEQLSLNDDSIEELGPFIAENDKSNNLEHLLLDQSSTPAGMQGDLNKLAQQQLSGDSREYFHQTLEDGYRAESKETLAWDDMLDYPKSSCIALPEKSAYTLDGHGMPLPPVKEPVEGQWLNFGGDDAPNCNYLRTLVLYLYIVNTKTLTNCIALPVSPLLAQEAEDFKLSAYSPLNTYGTNPDYYTTFFDQDHIGMPIEADSSLTIAREHKFKIHEISPEWGYASETTKVIIIGSFLHATSDCAWACMFGDIEVPIQIIQDGVISCQAPPHLPGKVILCITSGNRESCSEVRDFEYRVEPNSGAHGNLPDIGANKSMEELLLLVRFAQMLLFDSSIQSGETTKSGVDQLGKFKAGEDSWGHVFEGLLVGTWTASSTIDWLLQELLKDKLQQWLSSRLREGSDLPGCSLSKKEQGIIHMVAGLGFGWALNPILNSGVSVNFRDINGWTALHWAARFGREKMVAALMASGASAWAVTDPSPRDPTGKTPASIAATCGHKGLAGYLSEAALTNHLSSLRLEESELSKSSADVEAEITVNSVSKTNIIEYEEQLSLQDALAAVRNAAQAAARIQSAFRAHSFRMRQNEEAATFPGAASGDKYSILSNDIQGLSAASKLAFRNSRDNNAAALSIQKKYRGWKGRKDFLAFRQKVVKIQAHVRGHQVRKNYKVCWATGILEKVILRWRRRGVGLRGFRVDSESIDESEDEDILKVFRKRKLDVAIDEAVLRVLSMVDSQEARQQYHRMLERYRQAKAELGGQESEAAGSTSQADIPFMENDNIYQFA